MFETEHIGKISLSGDEEKTGNPEPDPTPAPMPNPDDTQKPSTSVQGTYTEKPSGIGGAFTGDSTNVCLLFVLASLSLSILYVRYKKSRL